MNATVTNETSKDDGVFVKVDVSVAEDELEPMIDAAWREISREVRLPGFRPGKAPRKLLEQQLGSGYARSEALRAGLPEFYARAVIDHDVDVIGPPELEITEGEESGPVAFTAIVEVRPVVEVAGYGGLRVEVPAPQVTDEEIDEQVDRIRSQYSDLVEVERAAGDGDYVTIDIHGSRDGEAVEGLTADDYLYLVGSGMIAPGFDEHLLGASTGDVVQFDAEAPGAADEDEPVEFRLLVKAVKERVLPDLTDEWVAEATEFDTAEELRDDIRSGLGEQREAQTRGSVRVRLGSELAKLVDGDVPEAMVSQDMQSRLQGLAYQLQGRGIGLDDYLRITGRDPETFSAELKEASDEAVRLDLALRAVAVAEAIEVSDAELDDEIALMIGDADLTIEAAREQLQSEGQLSAVRSELVKRAAMEWLVNRSEIVDPDGNPIPEEFLLEPEHDHDHDHDHEH